MGRSGAVTASTESPRLLGLDLVRATAIALVLISHCGDIFSSWFNRQPIHLASLSGFFGVELFFVLSGFLIGRLLIDIADSGPSLRAWGIFMVRRGLRTLPLYFAWLGVLLLIWPPEFWDPNRASVWHYVLSYGSLTQNLAWPMVHGWFGVSWSLTVEEWFYLLFSTLFLGGTAMVGRHHGLLIALLVFLVVPPALRYFMPVSSEISETIHKVAVFRLDAIAFGVAMTWTNSTWQFGKWTSYSMLLLGLTAVLFVWLGGLATVPVIGPGFRDRVLMFELTSAGFALCLPAALRFVTTVRPVVVCLRALSSQSYCIYLTHLSVLELTGYYQVQWRIPPTICIIGDILIIWGLSNASYRWFERPILTVRPQQSGARNADDFRVRRFSNIG
jgi:peptidoglycan/LPS O-acetylase OafA/YrhL